MQFRPLPGITIACAILFAFLIGLGVWQLQRLQWKLALIDEVNRNMHAKPVRLGDGGRIVEEALTDYLHVVVRGRFDNSKESYIYSTGPDGAPVYHVIVPLAVDNGETYLVDRGIVPRELKEPATRPAGIVVGEITVVGTWRWAEAPGLFTPDPDRAHRIWFFKDVVGIARADGVRLWQEGLIEADATPNPGGWPKGGQTVVTFRNEHLQYAITWFLMAAGLLAVYIAYHVSRGRLSFRRPAARV
jgi:surfeit locus 1 family protein